MNQRLPLGKPLQPEYVNVHITPEAVIDVAVTRLIPVGKVSSMMQKAALRLLDGATVSNPH